ncbi:MAG: hypothetical protein LBI80_03365 [Endomicrobium sp.]|jgi:hypothetical protein|nr:hypothetical protein [Endomicrobium sp.]
MTDIKNTFLNPPLYGGANRVDRIVNQLVDINAGNNVHLISLGHKISTNEAGNMLKIQNFCNIVVDLFYEIESIRIDILNNYYDDNNFNILLDQLDRVHIAASTINNSGTCSNNPDFVKAVNCLQSLVSAIHNHDLSRIRAINDLLKNNSPVDIGSLTQFFTDQEREDLITAITTTYSLT